MDECGLQWYVFGAQAAIVRTALIRQRPENARQARRLVEFVPVVISDVRADEILAHAVRRAGLAKVDPAVLFDDLRRHECETERAQALGHAEKSVIAKLHGPIFRGQNLR